MTEQTAAAPQAGANMGKRAIFLWLFLAVSGGAAGFYAVRSGVFMAGDSGPSGHTEVDQAQSEAAFPQARGTMDAETVFVPIDPIVISMGSGAAREHLRFRADLEVNAGKAKEVERVLPRIVDVLNGYLQALELDDLQDSAALIRLRAQMLRRVNIVTGGGVKNLLIIEFVLN